LARALDEDTRRQLNALPDSLDQITATITRNQALLSNDSRLPPFQTLSELHDESMNLAARATQTIAAAVKALEAIERTLITTSTQQALLRQTHNEQRRWKRKRLATQLQALAAFHARLQREFATLTQRRDKLMADILLLMEQGAGFRLLLRRHYDGIAVSWQQQRQAWLQLSADNWERALRGLPLHALPPFTGQPTVRRLKGIVLWYDPALGRGQIKARDGGAVIHVRRGSLHNLTLLHPGQNVGFALRVVDGTRWAEDVILIRQ
jgi:cold shock CspA family protein